MEELMKKLHSNDRNEWLEARNDLMKLANENPGAFQANFPKFLDLVAQSPHEELVMTIACALRAAQERFPDLAITHSAEIITTLERIAEQFTMDNAESPAGSGALCLLSILGSHLQNNQDMFRRAIPVLFQLLRKKHDVSGLAFGYINTWVYRSPQLFSQHVDDLLYLVMDGKKELLVSLMQMYSRNPEAFEKPNVMEFLVNTVLSDYSYQTSAMNILWEISKKKPELVAPHVMKLRPTLQSPMTASLALMILGNVAREQPDVIKPLVPDVYQVSKSNPQYKALVPNILGLVGRMSEDTAAEMLSLLADMLKDKDQATLVQILTEMKNLGEMNRQLLAPYIELVRQFTDDPQDYIRTQAQAIIDYYEGRDLKSLVARFEALNEEMKAAVQNFDDLKQYVDQHVSELKEFIAEINKKLPIPSGFSSEGRIRKTLTLYFTCAKQGERCLFPQDRPFTTQTKEFNKWLKVAVSAVKLGVAVVTSVTPVGAITSGPSVTSASLDAVRTLYQVLKDNPDDAEFLAIVSEPFLTSEEQDFLIKQLREAKYFQFFHYDAQTASWACSMCLE